MNDIQVEAPGGRQSPRGSVAAHDALAKPDRKARPIGPMLILALCAFMLPGILGHEPWKQDETYSFGIVKHMLTTGDWIVPTSAGQPFMEKPPLYYWLAASLARLLSPLLPWPDGARLASVVCLAITFAALAGCARIIGRAQPSRAGDGLLAVVTLAGCTGAVKHAHDMFTDVGLLAASAVALYAMLGLADAAAGARRDRRAAGFGALLGVAAAAALLTKGLFMPAVLAIAGVLVPVLAPACRNGRYLRGVWIALAAFAILAAPWPLLLLHRSPVLFREWFWVNNVGRFLGFSVAQLGSDSDLWTLVKAVFFFAFPAGPLALYGIATLGRTRLRQPENAVPLLVAVTGLVTLSVSATLRELYLLPLLPAFSLLATATLRRLPPRAQAGWDWTSRALAVVCALAIWSAWWYMRAPPPRPDWLARLGRWLPLSFVLPRLQPVAASAAVALTVGWLAAQTRFRRLGALRGALSWAAALTLAWGLTFTLLLPWLDAAKGYRGVFEQLAGQLRPQWRAGDCVATVDFGESEAPMFDYYVGIMPRPVKLAALASQAVCRWVAVQHRPENAVRMAPGWTQVWAGQRPGDDVQVFTLYRRAE